MAKLFIIIGLISLTLGLVLQFAPGMLNWFGHLPGDINIQNKNNTLFIPITSMLVVSIVLSLLINLFFHK